MGAGLAAVGVFALTLLSPVENTSSDPAIALVAAQCLVEHGSLDLGAYLDDPRLAYDLRTDRRIERRGDGYYYFSLGLPVLAAPAVWALDRLGWDMLDPAHEAAAQNLLSAFGCGLVLVLLFLACRALVPPVDALVIAASTVLGSGLVSTAGTALWASDGVLVLTSLALVGLARSERHARPRVWVPALIGVAVFVKPTAAFALLALVLSRLAPTMRRLGSGVLVLLASILVGVAAGAAGWLAWLPDYYGWHKIVPAVPLPQGLSANLLSPSRGLLVFSPFLVVVLVAVLVAARRAPARARTQASDEGGLVDDPLARFCSIWIALHLVAVSGKNMWWGGHGYGPRLLVEIMPPFAVLAALAWRALRRRPECSRARWAAAFLLTALPAVAINSYQGLFEPAVLRWNEAPDIDANALLVYDWRYPQFLASERSLGERLLLWQVRRLQPAPWDVEMSHDDWRHLAFSGWAEAEPAWRWSTAERATVVLLVRSPPSAPLYLLELVAGGRRDQAIGVRFNEVDLGTVRVAGFEPRRFLLALPVDAVVSGQNRVRFDMPGAGPLGGDPRLLGMALRSMALLAVDEDLPAVRYDDDRFFGEGWSGSESGWRWTEGRTASLRIAAGALDADAPYRLRLRAGTRGRQRVAVTVGGRLFGELIWQGFEPRDRTLQLPPGTITPLSLNEIGLSLPDAAPTAEDPRLLGLALREVRLERADRGVAGSAE